MNCFDCAGFGITSEAVAVCADCGAGLCVDHAHAAPRWLTRTMVINQTVCVEPAARSIYCGTCHGARVARGDVDGVVRPRRPTKNGAWRDVPFLKRRSKVVG